MKHYPAFCCTIDFNWRPKKPKRTKELLAHWALLLWAAVALTVCSLTESAAADVLRLACTNVKNGKVTYYTIDPQNLRVEIVQGETRHEWWNGYKKDYSATVSSMWGVPVPACFRERAQVAVTDSNIKILFVSGVLGGNATGPTCRVALESNFSKLKISLNRYSGVMETAAWINEFASKELFDDESFYGPSVEGLRPAYKETWQCESMPDQKRF